MFYCPHHAHDGRGHGHTLGEAPRTKAFFTAHEVEFGLAPVDAALLRAI